MSSDRWQQVAEVFQEVLDCPAPEREDFLKSRCGDDPDLLKSVVSLLEADEEADVFMEEPLVPGVEEPEAHDNRHFGVYRTLRKIGEGGTSIVFLGVRDDETFRRRVAIKLIRRGMESDDALRRLRTERQILASLHHPAIAEIYDGGTTSEGLPYFVMEYIDGVPIDKHCEDHQLPVAARIELFRKVCAAVHYAHQNLVVHRDIKPANILVTPEGLPKLLDFGIAKLLNPELSPSELDSTATWLRLLTPHYASPEQVRGEMVTTASDVYSLGVLLYKLLTGQLPRQFSGHTLQEIERELTTKEPIRPSALVGRETSPPENGKTAEPARSLAGGGSWRIRPEQISRQLQGDLDMIVLKALRTSPEQRYSSVEQFSEDLGRHLVGFPVRAREGNFRYRAGKFLRRHWVVVTVTALIVTLSLSFAGITVVQSAAITRQRDQARQERDEKEQVLALVEDVFQLADPDEAQGKDFTVREALDRSAASIAGRLQNQPAVEAALRRTLGNIYLNLGFLDEAEFHLNRVLEVHRQLFGEGSLEVAQSMSGVGAVLRERGEYDRAQRLSEEAVTTSRLLLGSDHPGLIEPLNYLVTLYCYRGDYGAADAPSQETLALARKYLNDTHSELAAAVTNRAVVLRKNGDLEAAEKMYREALKIQRTIGQDEHPQMANILNNLAIVLRNQGNLEEAAGFHRETLALRRKLYGDRHSTVAQSHANLAAVLQDQEKYAEAQAAYGEALEILLESLGKTHPATIQVTLALSDVHLEADQADAAEPLLRRGLDAWRRELSADHPLLARAENALGEALVTLGRYGEAETLLVPSAALLEEQNGAGAQRTRRALERLVALYQAWEKPDKAAQYRKRLEADETLD